MHGFKYYIKEVTIKAPLMLKVAEAMLTTEYGRRQQRLTFTLPAVRKGDRWVQLDKEKWRENDQGGWAFVSMTGLGGWVAKVKGR
ncbi:hypothetical protein M514_02717 [Trichuris suis]|uniref:Uncharacterized protein n=1 Tax=Trichuris suis TaxID=68888 RepID=A0A085NH66_9BILA|nr:hypothetical protein M513_02717 [Trichuris suis]KFD68812.1 hypothetical protein M514_02717 [Trichuris suis]